METRLQPVYKLVFTDGAELRSFNLTPDHPEFNEQFSLVYKPGEWTYPKIKGSLLFALSKPEPFCVSYTELWEAQADVVENHEAYLPGVLDLYLTLSQAQFFWNNPFGYDGKVVPVNSIFESTVLCTRIMITKKVSEEELHDLFH